MIITIDLSFLDNLPRLSAPNYLPTEQDLLRTRIKVNHYIYMYISFSVDNWNYRSALRIKRINIQVYNVQFVTSDYLKMQTFHFDAHI
jgi:hypothetical protein